MSRIILIAVLMFCPMAVAQEKPLVAAMVEIEAGRWDSAIVELSKVIDAGASDAEAHFWRGFVYAKKSDSTRAWEDVRKARILGYDEFNTAWGEQLRIDSEFEKLIAAWKQRLKESQRDIVAIDDGGDAKIAAMKRQALDEISALAKNVGEIEKKRDVAAALEKSESAYHITVQLNIENQFRQLRKIDGIASYQLAAAEGKTRGPAVIYIVPAVTDVKILPRDPYLRGEISDSILISAAPGEYEPASFVVAANEELQEVKIVAGDLKTSGGASIPADRIDIKLLKCWFQGFEAWYGLQARQPVSNQTRKVLVPELLLNDDTLVKVDLNKQEQEIRLNLPDGEKYVSITDPDAPAWNGLPIKDADTLLPLNVPAGENRQFWITLRVPDDAAAGSYEGVIEISAAGQPLGTLKLTATVLPFHLQPPYYTSSMFYTGSRYAMDIANLQRHGVFNPVIFYYRGMTEAALREMLQARKDLGLAGQPLYLYEYTTSLEGALWTDIKHVRRVIEMARTYDVSEVYFYGLDEVGGEKLVSQRPYWRAIHEAGGEILEAGGIKQGNFELVGDLLDILVSGYHPEKAQADRWHAQGKKIWNYANPQGGIENPEIWRRNYGLLLWRENFDGAATWMDYTGTGNPWNDFDFKAGNYRDQVMFYPTDDGLINTIALAGYREGVDDVRYMTTLEKAIAQAAPTAQRSSARAFVSKLRSGDLIYHGDLHEIRGKIIEHLMKLK